MEIKIELRVDVEGSSWAMRIDGHEWQSDMTTAAVNYAVMMHVSATMDCLIAEATADPAPEVA